MSREEYLEERFSLVTDRIFEIKDEEKLPEQFLGYFRKTADFLGYLIKLHGKIQDGWLKTASLEELRENNERLYQDILPEHYETSYANPAYAEKLLGKEFGPMICFLEAEI